MCSVFCSGYVSDGHFPLEVLGVDVASLLLKPCKDWTLFVGLYGLFFGFLCLI